MTSGGNGFVFAQISDPHLTSLAGVSAGDIISKRALGYLSWRRKRRDEHRAEVLQALQDDLASSAASHVLVTGDLTHIGLPAEFSQARHWLDQLAVQLGTPASVSVIPGNHDCYVRASWADTYQQWLPFLASDGNDLPNSVAACFPSYRIRGDVAFIGVSSAVPTPPLFASGTVGRPQLTKLAKLLEDAARAGLYRVVYLHHPPIAGVEKWRKRLTDAASFRQVIARHGADLMLYGHCHKFRRDHMDTANGKIPVIGLPSASALGEHGEPAGYNLYRLGKLASGEFELDVESRRYNRAAHCFETVTGQA